jgi:hypothetical protein
MTIEEKLAFQALLAQRIREKVDVEGVALVEHAEDTLAENFVSLLIELKGALSQNDSNYHQIQGETAWSTERERIILNFANQLDTVFAPIGGINPGAASAYWSGEGRLRAETFGKDFGNTIPGFVINQVSTSLQDVFTPQAYTASGALDTATNIAMWDGMSRLYARNTKESAHVFLVDGETSHCSVFWNTELATLREQQAQGIVKEIVLHTLTKETLISYKELLQQEKAATNADDKKVIREGINQLLQTPSSWENVALDDSSNFRLKTSGFSDTHRSVSFQSLKKIASVFKNTLSSNKIKGVEKEFADIQRSMVDGTMDETLATHLEKLKGQIQRLKPSIQDPILKNKLDVIEEQVADIERGITASPPTPSA